MTEPIDKLLTDAMEVVNRSLEANRGRGMFGKALEMVDDALEGHVTTFLVYDEDPSDVFDAFTLRYRNGRFELLERGKGDNDSEWKVSRAYLRSLVDDPELYIEHPWRLDLDWLANRVPGTFETVVR